MNNDDKGVELTTPLNPTQEAEDRGGFGIGTKELATFTNLDGTHPIAKG